MVPKHSILIVDDEVNVTRTLQLVLERDGYDVTPAYSCAEALGMLNGHHRFDVIITDLNMEREDIGLDLARAAKALKKTPLVVVCTGYATVENAEAALRLHVDYLATKPVDLDELKAALRRMLALRMMARESGAA